ncbi:MAG TPA: DUF2231 domain-containing protein [Anaerolineales bacterium]|nr:DUF2231 domain-containing protein [Anaerolineales bacterium]
MESRVKFFGHPVHPMLIVFPIGLLATSLFMDILYLITGNILLTTASYYMIAAGIIGGLLAAIFGFIDWLGLPGDSRAKRIGGWHGIGNFVIVVLFIISWLLRRGDPNFVPGGFALILSFVGILMALVTAWIGGELVYRLGVAVDPGANVNAPSSLSEQSATGTKTKRTASR